MELQYESLSSKKQITYFYYEHTHRLKSLLSIILNNQKFHKMESFLVSHKIGPILELNNDLKIFPHFTKEKTESERREVVK